MSLEYELNPKFLPIETRALIFDLDDTLQTCIEPKVQQYLDTAARLKVHIDEERVKEVWQQSKSFPSIVATLFGQDNFESAMADIKKHYDEYPKRLYEDTLPVLSGLGNLGIRMGYVTSLEKEMVEEDAKTTGLDLDIFEFGQAGNKVGPYKPDPAVFDGAKRWLKSVGITGPDAATYIGDAHSDLLASRNAGLRFLGIERGFLDKKDFFDAGAVSVSALTQILRKKVPQPDTISHGTQQ